MPSRLSAPSAHPWVRNVNAGGSYEGALGIGVNVVEDQVYEWRGCVPTISRVRVDCEGLGVTEFVLQECTEVLFLGLFERRQPLIDHLAGHHLWVRYSHVLSGDTRS